MVPNVIERVWVQGTTTKVESLRGTAFTEEDGAHTFRIAGVDASGETVPLSGTVLAKILRADNITIDVSGTITDGVASVTMVGDCYHVPGRFSIVVYLSDGVTTIAIYAAVGDIYRATSDTELDSGTTVPSLVQLEAAYQNALSAAAAANTAATGAERVNVSMSKSGDTITFSATDRTGATTTATMSDQSEEVADLESDVTDLENNVANLNSAINVLQNTAVVQLETEEATFHNVTPESVSFYPDSRINTVTAKYTNSKNMVYGEYIQGVQNGITKAVSGNMLMLTGTGTNQVIFVQFTNEEKIANFKGKTFNVYVYIQKSTAWEFGNYFQLYDGVRSPIKQWLSKGTTTMIGWKEFKNVSIDENATVIQIKFTDATDNVFAEGDFIWIGMYETELVDTNQTVTGEDPYTIAISGFNCIDTAMHNSTVRYIEPTKDYVDNHIPDIKTYWTEEIYALPEKFGAVGDGVEDDTQALLNCIAYAKTNNKPIRGFGTYKTSGTIVLDGKYLDAYLKEIKYTGNESAVSLQHNCIVFGFHRIVSSNIGISFEGTTNYARQCQVTGNEIDSTSHCIVIGDLTLYCTCDIRYLKSSEGDCIHRNRISTFGGGEFVFRSSSCACPNGYVSYNNGVDKFYDFTVEANCKYGLLNPSGCLCVGWRHREQVGGMKLHIIEQNPAYNNGALITFTQQPNGEGHDAFRYISSDDIPWHSIDLSALEGYDTIPAGENSITEWHKLAYTGIEIGATIRGSGAGQHTVFGSRTFFIGGHLVCEPEGRNICVLSQATYDMTLFDSSDPSDIRAATSFELAKAWATDFVTGYAHSDLYLNASFGAIGYNDLTLTQKDGNTATIYDKQGNVLFDGTNEGNGKWSLKCFINRSSMGRYGGTTAWWCYDGTNETWEVTKIG